MKNDILYNEKSHTKEAANLADLLNLPVNPLDIAGSDAIAQIDAQENIDHALGEIPTSWLKPFFMTTEQIDVQENVDNALDFIVTDGSDKTPAPTDEQGNVSIVPISPDVPMIIFDPEGFTTVPKIAIDPEGFTTEPKIAIDPAGFTTEPKIAIDPAGFTTVPKIAIDPEGFTTVPKIAIDPAGFTTPFGLGWVDPSWTIDPVTGSYIDDPISGMIDSIGEKPSLTMGRIPDSWLRNQSLNTTDLPISMNIVSTKGSTAGNDILTGTASNDRLSGLAGNDTLDGASGNDVLNGGVGNDVLMGGIGKDKLTGGAGADTFKFVLANESTFWSMDTITDFKRAQGDKIDLSAIDSDSNLVGDQGFKLVNAFSVDATGQLYFDAKTHVLYGSTDADSAPEFAITLSGVNTLLPADFTL